MKRRPAASWVSPTMAPMLLSQSETAVGATPMPAAWAGAGAAGVESGVGRGGGVVSLARERGTNGIWL